MERGQMHGNNARLLRHEMQVWRKAKQFRRSGRSALCVHNERSGSAFLPFLFREGWIVMKRSSFLRGCFYGWALNRSTIVSMVLRGLAASPNLGLNWDNLVLLQQLLIQFRADAFLRKLAPPDTAGKILKGHETARFTPALQFVGKDFNLPAAGRTLFNLQFRNADIPCSRTIRFH
jgi:hypothetical protein